MKKNVFYCKDYESSKDATALSNEEIEKVVVFESPSVQIVAPKVVYKYRDYNKEYDCRVLTHRELYLSSPLHFDDIHDCSLDYYTPTKTELFDYYRKNLPYELLGTSRCEQRRYAKEMVSGYYKNNDNKKEIQRSIDIEHFKQFGVLSVSKRSDIDYMWKKYADNHKGFCVGFDTKVLCNSCSFGGGGDVVYYTTLPFLYVDEPVQQRIRKSIFSKKQVPYVQENEYRFTKSWPYEATEEDRKIIVPPQSVVSIILGSDMDEKDKKEIKKIHEAFFSSIKLIEL